jgi:two-component system nitrogen regulation response regulator NtrX
MTLRMQGLFLRFLETGELQKVGADRIGRAVNVRVIAATNRNLQDMIAQGQFREDLFYRLNVIHFWVPPLREQGRRPQLIEHFLKRFTRDRGLPAREISPTRCARCATTLAGQRATENAIGVSCGHGPMDDVESPSDEVRAPRRVGPT